ncbi:flagellar protein FlaG [Paenibacillus dakarensis]|uniref:flagellar protein FlaG n=1 Tax=Paenibacillus dakarensis TaxID=1527293 RepID=UPI0006D5384C|nr:flagellar protein FlaG [Paenibacillus dakarensis]
MNLQISVTANTVSSAKVEGNQVSEYMAANKDASLINSIKKSTEIAKLERQGIQIPTGDEHLIRLIEKATKALQGPETTLEISIHEKTHQIMVKVLNKENGELIREIPPEKTLDLVANMMEIAGILVDQKV